MSIIGERIKGIRKAKRDTQEIFAKKLGISRTHMNRIETGKAKASNHLIKLICEKYGLPEDWLKYGSTKGFIDTPANEIDTMECVWHDVTGFMKETEAQLDYTINFCKFYINAYEDALEEYGKTPDENEDAIRAKIAIFAVKNKLKILNKELDSLEEKLP